MEQAVFSQMNTLVRVKESALLNAEQLNSLVNAPDYQSAVFALKEMGYGVYFAENAVADLSGAFNRAKQDLISWAYDITPQPELVDLFSFYETVHILKVLLKEKVTGRSLDHLSLHDGRYELESLRGLVAGEGSGEFPPDWEKAVRDVLEDFERCGSMQRLELKMDLFYFEGLKSLAEKTGNQEVSKFVSHYIDLYNLSALLQLGEDNDTPKDLVFASGGLIPIQTLLEWNSLTQSAQHTVLQNSGYYELWRKSESEEGAALFDIAADNYLMEKCRMAKLDAFGYLPFCAYLFAKSMEIKNLRMILSGKRYGVSAQEIGKRMRNPYEL